MAAVDRWLLPDGIEEVLPPDAEHIEEARRQVLDLFRRWGYELVITPHIEFLESLQIHAGQDLDLKTFKVIDPISGRQMGLRADITPQVARIDAHTMPREGVSRLCYAGSVIHARPRALTSSRSPIQIGAELYGEANGAADLEVICLMLSMLDQAGVADVHMDLGHVGIYRALVREAGLSGEAEAQLFDALQRKSADEVEQLTAGLTPVLAAMFRALPVLCGGADVLPAAAKAFAGAPEAVIAALADLSTLASQLQQRFPQLPLYFDLAELRGYHYHTGVVFAAFVPGSGEAIAQGGRYDEIGADFGRARPATGFSADLKTLVDLGSSLQVGAPASIWAPAEADPALWDLICELRAQGERVVQSLGESGVAPGCNRRLNFEGGRWIVAAV